MDEKLKHLEFIQATISRMAGNSFLLKGWSLTLVAAVIALVVKEGNPAVIPVAFLPVVVFWALDAYFLRQERLFRALYDHVRLLPVTNIDFGMQTEPFQTKVKSVWRIVWSRTILTYHGSLFGLVTILSLWAYLREAC